MEKVSTDNRTVLKGKGIGKKESVLNGLMNEC
jgi:hypothetical protein